MRKIKLISLLLLGVPCLSFTSNEQGSFITITAFELEIDENNKKIILTNKFDSSVNRSDYFVDFCWYYRKDGVENPLDYTRMSNFKIVTDETVNIKPTINISELGAKNEFILYLYPCDIKGPIIKTLRCDLKGNSEVTFSEKDNDVGVTSGYYVESQSLRAKDKNYIKEDRVTFSNYEDLVVEDYYLNFDIRRFKYRYSGKKEVIEGNFYLLIYDKYNYFEGLPLYKSSQYRYIELTPSICNGDSVFSFKDNIYVNPINHNVSNTYIEGYKKTNKLYFPIGKLDQLRSVHCKLSFDIKGYTNFNMSSEFDICFLRNYFGDCSDSEFCIGMNSDDGINVREKVIDINL